MLEADVDNVVNRELAEQSLKIKRLDTLRRWLSSFWRPLRRSGFTMSSASEADAVWSRGQRVIREGSASGLEKFQDMTETIAPPPGAGRAFAGILASSFATMFLIAGAGVYSANAMAEFDAVELLGLAFTLESLARCVTLPLAGSLGDRRGRREGFLASVLAYIASTVLCAVSPSALVFLVGRTLMGLAWGLFMANSFAMIADLYAAEEGTRRTGYMQSVGIVAMLVASPVAGLLADLLSWRMAFWVTVPALAAGWLLVASGMPRSARAEAGPIDIGGVICLAVALTPFSLAMAWGGRTVPWDSLAMRALLAAAVAGSVGLVLVERKARQPIFPATVLGSRPFLTVFAATVLYNLAGAVGNFLPAFVQSTLGESATVAGLAIMPGMVVSAVGSSVMGRYLAARQRYRAAMLFWAATFVAATAIYLTFGPGTSLIVVFAATTVMGFPRTASQVVPYAFPMFALKPELVASGIALTTFGGGVANTIASGLYTAVANTGLENVFRVTITFALLCLVVALVYRDPKPAGASGPPASDSSGHRPGGPS
jgi:MFS family permease